jgi:predicted ATP-binding protein involved in virulence
MKLEKLRVENFRCFSDLEVELHPRMTVLVAENGQGKSSVLDAVRIALWPFVAGFDLARNAFNDPGNAITVDDVHLIKMASGDMARQLPARIFMSGDYDGSGRSRTWMRCRDKEARATKTKDDQETGRLKVWVSDIQSEIRNPASLPRTLPVFGYYGTGRLWSQKKLTETTRGKDDTKETDFYVRTFGYLNCLDPASTYKHFKEWFIWAYESYLEKRLRLAERPGQISEAEIQAAFTPIKVIQKTVDVFLQDATGWHRLEYSISDGKTLVLNHETDGKLKVDQLSDGIRSVLAMVGDIAYRCVKLNPHLGENAALETHGVVMIDKADMHLHPRWQQVIIEQFQRAFPNIQFIITTHSPQILSTVRRESVRIIHQLDGSYVASMPEFSPLAHESGAALARIMGTHPYPETPLRETIHEYEQIVRTGREGTDEAIELLLELNAAGYQFDESDLETWRFLAKRAARRE